MFPRLELLINALAGLWMVWITLYLLFGVFTPIDGWILGLGFVVGGYHFLTRVILIISPSQQKHLGLEVYEEE